MKRLLLMLALVCILVLSGCASQVKTTCTIYPRLKQENQANVGTALIQKEVCASGVIQRFPQPNLRVDECGMSELIYLGKSGDSIRIGYREFVQDMARPSYFMEVTYPANVGKLIYRNTEFEVTFVGETYIKYKLISTPTEKCETIYYRETER